MSTESSEQHVIKASVFVILFLEMKAFFGYVNEDAGSSMYRHLMWNLKAEMIVIVSEIGA